eukprot:CAMPEP_0118871236 /NCGR_PEP_ID=MMETSP1163-20130328/13905_1 /TAXON_ID=124430 /ORGANISM="Phaeomonas parva, Strain CCMP2877" /LENGTH=121 /DNA_ID=CAMNT_0006806325 /DNA_START=124 /DNA_END=489 /DNA_ORIENTATION=-
MRCKKSGTSVKALCRRSISSRSGSTSSKSGSVFRLFPSRRSSVTCGARWSTRSKRQTQASPSFAHMMFLHTSSSDLESATAVVRFVTAARLVATTREAMMRGSCGSLTPPGGFPLRARLGS